MRQKLTASMIWSSRTYVASPEDYEKYAKFFTGDALPYTEEEIKALAELSYEDLAAACAKLSVEDVVSRHAK